MQTLLHLPLAALAVLMLRPPIALGHLRSRIQEVACEEQVILGGDSKGVAHESECIGCKSACHRARDPKQMRQFTYVLHGDFQINDNETSSSSLFVL